MNILVPTQEQVHQMFPEADEIESPIIGGQKLVYKCKIKGEGCVIKFIPFTISPEALEEGADLGTVLDGATARARREVEILLRCTNPHLVRLGLIRPKIISYEGHHFVCFSEELICGKNLRQIINVETLDTREVIRLGHHISEAIEALWKLETVHRDIKPENIMRRDSDGSFVLLDMGCAFDHQV